MIKCTVLMQIEFCRGFIIRKRDGWGACTEELAGQQSVVRESRRSAPVSGAPDMTEKASKFAARDLSGDASLPCTGQAGSYSVGSFTPASRKAGSGRLPPEEQQTVTACDLPIVMGKTVTGPPPAGQAGSYSVGSFTPASRKASLRSTHVPHFPQWTSEPL